jgi:membrane associated rhomboid family serine protease
VYRRRHDPITWGLIALDTIIFFVIWMRGPAAKEATVLALGHAREAVWEGEFWRLLTAVFLHDGWWHLFLNMFVLQSFGRHVERLVGSVRFLALFLAAGLGGSLFFQATSTAGLAVGASGAVAGVVGAFLVVWARFTSRSVAGARLRLLASFAFVVLGDLAFGYLIHHLQPRVGIAVSAHFGGLVTGAALGHAFAIGDAAAPPVLRRLVPISAGLIVFFGICLYAAAPTMKEIADGIRLRDLSLELERDDVDAALATWREFRPESNEVRSQLGYEILYRLLEGGRKDLASGLLEELIQDAEAELARLHSNRNEVDPWHFYREKARLLNEIAWSMALRGEDLKVALDYAEAAVSLGRERVQGAWLESLFGGNSAPDLATSLNTQGWIEVLVGRHEAGIEHLSEAARMDPRGVYYVWLALAHERLGNRREAREAADLARKARDPMPRYERRLLEELEADLGG